MNPRLSERAEAQLRAEYNQLEQSLRCVVERERRRLRRWQRTARTSAVFCFLAGVANIVIFFRTLFHLWGG